MNALAALIPIPDGTSIPRHLRLDRQRQAARQALLFCAEQLKLPADGWRQDEQRVPLPRDGYHWSIAHKRLWAAAVIADQPVGIDIEHIAPRPRDLWAACATPDEQALFDRRDWPDFFRLWTAKESVLKANRVGLARLDDCVLTSIEGPMRMLVTFAYSPWQVEHFACDDHIAAVAGHDLTVDWRVMQP